MHWLDDAFVAYVRQRSRGSVDDADYHRYAKKSAERGNLSHLHQLAREVALTDIGSLWRVNWDEVAAALSQDKGKTT